MDFLSMINQLDPIICIIILNLHTSIINMLAVGKIVNPVHWILVTLFNNLLCYILFTPVKEEHNDSDAQK